MILESPQRDRSVTILMISLVSEMAPHTEKKSCVTVHECYVILVPIESTHWRNQYNHEQHSNSTTLSDKLLVNPSKCCEVPAASLAGQYTTQAMGQIKHTAR